MRQIPEATVARLPVYLRSLTDLDNDQHITISSEQLAESVGVNAAKVRKDLSYLGSFGTRGVGYDVKFLINQMSRALGLNRDCPVIIVGLGNLGLALSNYGGFEERGFPVAALVDSDPTKIGRSIAGHTVVGLDSLSCIVAEHPNVIGVITTPSSAAQDVADALGAAGVRSILNFAPVVINSPTGVSVRKVDLAVELQILSFYDQHRQRTARIPDVAKGA